MTQRDLVLRWIEQIARVVRRLLQGGGPADVELARERVREAIEQHLGPLALLVPRLDPEAAAGLLHDPDRIEGLALLLELESAIAQAEGRPTQAAGLTERSAALRAAAARRDRAG